MNGSLLELLCGRGGGGALVFEVFILFIGSYPTAIISGDTPLHGRSL